MRQKTVMKVIRLMRDDLQKGMTILEISKNLKIGYRPAYNHVTELEREGVMTTERVGNSRQCRLNLRNEKTTHLLESLDIDRKEEILAKNKKLKTVIETMLLKIDKTSDIQSVVLFGSYVKGNETRQSDIDLLFIVHNIKDAKTRESIERMCNEYTYSHNMNVSPLITDIKEIVSMLASENQNVGKEIRHSGISLYGHEVFWRVIS